MTTHTVASGFIESLNDAKPEPTPLKASLTEILGDPTPTVRSSVLNSFISALNLALVAQCRTHVRFGDTATRNVERVDPNEERTIDFPGGIDHYGDHEAQDRTRELNDYTTSLAGNVRQVPAIEIAKHLGLIRSHALDLQAQMSQTRPPRPLGESIDFLLSTLPTEVDATAPHIKVLATLLKKAPSVIALMAGENNKQERAQLVNDTPEIISLATSLSEACTGDEQSVELAFDSLPPVNQINVFTSACNALVSAYNAAFKKVLRGNVAAAADMTIAEAMYHRATAQLDTLLKRNANAVADLEDRGGSVKVLKLIA